MNVLGYARVSTKDQELNVQKEQIEKFCYENKHNLIEILEDRVSGRKASRPGWDIILKNVEEKSIDGIVFLRADRIARSTKNLLDIVELFVENKIKMFSINDKMFQDDLDSPQGKLFITVMGAMSEFEANIISERMREGKERAARVGTRSGKPMHRPFIEIDWNTYYELRKLGLSKRLIAKKLGVSESKLYKELAANTNA